jgi:DNA-binding NarL/FixJ family response regulator
MKRPTRILLLDNHDLAKNDLVSLLSDEPDLLVAGHARTVTKAIALATRHPPDLALIEMQLPDASGMDACQRLLAVAPQVRVLVLTSRADDTMVAAAIRSGAHGYILKDVKANELIRAIRTVAGGRGYLDSRITHHALRWIRASAGTAAREQKAHQLSPQERLIMPLVVQGKTNKEIAAALHLSDKTVKNYLTNIYDKLGVNRRTEAVARFVQTNDPPPTL